MASDEERAGAARASTRSSPHELAQLYRLMSRLELATPLRRTRRYERGRHGRAHRHAADAAREPAHRRRSDPPRAPAPARRAAARLVMLCDISGSMEPYARAYLQFLTCAAGSGPERRGVRLRHAADAPDPRAGLAPSRARDPARRRRGARLVERHPDRRRAEGVQRPPRPPRHGARRGGRDPLRRLGARRPEARRARDGAPRAPRPPDRVGQPARQRRARSPCGPAAWSAALPHCDALVSGHSFEALGEVVEAIGGTASRGARAGRRGRAEPRDEEPWASATPVPGSSVAMPSGYGPSRGNTTPGWVTDE